MWDGGVVVAGGVDAVNVELSSGAGKYLAGLDRPVKDRIKAALRKLEKEPPEGDIKSMTGKDGYRLRVGKYRVLFDYENGHIIVHEIGLRGQIYKGG